MPKLPEKIDDWQAPWEKAGEELDPEKAKALLFSLHREVETAKTGTSEAKTKVKALETQVGELTTQLEAKVGEGGEELTRVTRELATTQKKLDAVAQAASEQRSRALDVALDIDGISAKQAKALAGLLQGDDAEAMQSHAESVIESLGIQIGEAERAEPKLDSDLVLTNGRTKPLRIQGGDDGSDALPDASIENLNRLFG